MCMRAVGYFHLPEHRYYGQALSVAPRIWGQPWLGRFAAGAMAMERRIARTFFCAASSAPPQDGQGLRVAVTGCCAHRLCY